MKKTEDIVKKYADDPTPQETGGDKEFDVPWDHLTEYSGKEVEIDCESEGVDVHGHCKLLVEDNRLFFEPSDRFSIEIKKESIVQISDEDQDTYRFDLKNGKISYMTIIDTSKEDIYYVKD